MVLEAGNLAEEVVLLDPAIAPLRPPAAASVRQNRCSASEAGGEWRWLAETAIDSPATLARFSVRQAGERRTSPIVTALTVTALSPSL